MKKITLLIVLLTFSFSWYGNAQITTYPYSEDFEAGPGGWVATNGANGTWALGTPAANVINSAASGANAWTTNLTGNYNANENSFVQSPVFDLTSLTAPSIEFRIWWNAEFSWDGMVLQSSINSGGTWQNVGALGDPNNWFNDGTINGNPGGQQVGWTGRVAVTNNGSNGWRIARHALTGLAGQSNVIFRFAFGSDGTVQDNGVAFDLVSIYDVSCPEPAALTVNSIVATTVNLGWTAGGPQSNWEFVNQLAGTPAPTNATSGTPISTNFVEIMNLTEGADYQFYVRTDCGAGEYSGWVGPLNYSISGPGETCGNPLVVTTLPYVTDDNTANYGDDYSGGPGTNCGSTSGYLGGDDVVYSYTPAADTSITITLTPGGTWSGLFVYTSCADIGVACANGVANSGSGIREIILPVTAGTTYYIVISTWPTPQSIPYNLTITENTCTDAVATYSVNGDCSTAPQFFVEVDLTSLGSASSITMTDNQGSTPQTTGVTGVFNFGPYANTTDVVITVTNDNDANCVLTSPTLTQEFCQDFVVDCSVGPQTLNYCYSNGGATNPVVFTFTSNDGTPLNLNFNSGFVEQGWDELVVIDTNGSFIVAPTDLFYGNGGDLSGLTYQSTGDTISFYINSDGVFSCETNGYAPIDVTVSCATCINPTATYAVVDDCANGDQFLIDVNVTSLGDATSLTISNNINGLTTPVPATGVYQIGPFPFVTPVVVTLSNDQDVNCVINSPAFQLLACPPDNDNPCDATVAVVNDSFICAESTPGSLIEATASGVPSGTCTGNPNDDIWFQFVAESEFQLIALANMSGSDTFNIDHAIYGGTCDNLVPLACESANLSSITPQLTIGNTYFIRVFSGGANPVTTTFDLCITPYEAPTNIACTQANNYCSAGGDILYTPNVVNMPNNSSVACLGTIPNPTYSVLEIGTSGEVLIEIVQNTAFDANDNPIGDELDVDYVLWGPFTPDTDFCTLGLEVDCPSCPNNTTNPNFYPFGNIVDCSYSAQAFESVTLQNAIAGEIYLLLVTNFDQDAGIIQVTQTNVGATGAGNITSDIQVTLDSSEGFDICGIPSTDLVAASPFADSYEWFLNDGLITGQTSATLTITESGTYKVIAYDENCGAEAEDTLVIVFGDEAQLEPIDPIITCDDLSADEIENFDLQGHIANFNFLNGQDASMFNITFHLTQSEANQNINPLTSPYNNVSNPQTIYVRFSDVDAAFCSATSSFQLIISGPQPTANSVDINECDDDYDGFTDFDLAAHDANVLGSQDANTFTVTYYETQADAEAGTNPIDTSSLYNSTSKTIWTRIESNIAFDCYSVIDFDLIVDELPNTTFTTDFDYEVCPNATVPIIITATGENYAESDVTINWLQDGVPITGQTGLALPVLLAGTYTIEVVFNGTQCSSSADIEVIQLEQCIFPQGISPGVSPGQNDFFDLSSFNVTKLEIFNRNGTLVYSKNNYTNEWHGQSNNGDELPVGTYFYTVEYDGGKQKSAWVYINK